MTTWTPSAGDETGNAAERRRAVGWYERYLVGDVLDIGAGKTPVVPHARVWDIAAGDGDAAALRGIAPESFDAVYASHILEHMDDPVAALAEWWTAVRTGGHLIVAVPHCGLYERRVWPSVFNADHRTTWDGLVGPTVTDGAPESHHELLRLIGALPCAELIEFRVCDDRYDHDAATRLADQPSAERQIEAVVRRVAPPVWRSSFRGAVRCTCGYDRPVVMGVALGGRLLISCPACGQGSSFDMADAVRRTGGTL